MAMLNPYNKYKQNSINTATKEELTLMLYEGALKFCNQAIIAVQNKDIVKAHDMIVKVEDIIMEFQITLDHKYEVSKGLNSLYTYILKQLRTANIKKDASLLEEVRGYIRELRDTWKEAMALAKAPPLEKKG